MAFKRKNMQLIPGGGDTGLIIYSDNAALNTIKGNAYWATSVTGEDADARLQLEAFVKRYQVGTGSTGSVPITIVGNNGMDMDAAYLHTDGRVRIRGGAYSLKT